MSFKDTATILIMGVAIGLAAAAAVRMQPPKETIPAKMTCLLETKHHDDTTKSRITGYNYHLLRSYAASRGIRMHIRLVEDGENAPDSLRAGAADLVVVPFGKVPEMEDARHSIPVDSTAYWMVRQDRRHLLKDIDKWLLNYNLSDSCKTLHKKFLNTYNPYRVKEERDFLSPYDDLIRTNADSLGWDWRLLAAVIYKESHFSISVRSHRGAVGIMQVRPMTADRLGVDDLLDPVVNIHTGTRYLRKINYMFRDIEDPAQRIKMTLAGYNAGENRIQSCREFAREKGYDGNSWDDIVSLIPEMENFKGTETIAYIEDVDSLYRQFTRICP